MKYLIRCLILVMFMGGCASMGYQDAIGAAYLARTTLAEAITAECGNTVPDGPCVAQSAISTEQKQAAKSQLVLAGAYLADAQAIQAGRVGISCSGKWECLEAARGALGVVENMLEASQ